MDEVGADETTSSGDQNSHADGDIIPMIGSADAVHGCEVQDPLLARSTAEQLSIERIYISQQAFCAKALANMLARR